MNSYHWLVSSVGIASMRSITPIPVGMAIARLLRLPSCQERSYARARWALWLESRSSSSRESARGRSARCCSPTSARKWFASIGSRSRGKRSGPDTFCCAAVARSPSISRARRGWRRCCGWSSGPTRLIEGFRPGVMERLGLGPDVCLARNPRLVYGRMTGWGQDGPLAHAAGHDINYIALTGALRPIARRGEPPRRRSISSATSAAAAYARRRLVCGAARAHAFGQGPGGRRGDGRRRRAR